MSRSDELNNLLALIEDLETKLADLESRLPAHSIPPNLISEMDVLDEQLQVEKNRLAALLSAKESTEQNQN